jgi:hypothetical protein
MNFNFSNELNRQETLGHAGVEILAGPGGVSRWRLGKRKIIKDRARGGPGLAWLTWLSGPCSRTIRIWRHEAVVLA